MKFPFGLPLDVQPLNRERLMSDLAEAEVEAPVTVLGKRSNAQREDPDMSSGLPEAAMSN